MLRLLLIPPLVALAAWAIVVLPRRPKTDRPWIEEHREQAWGTVEDDALAIHRLRDFAWGASGPDRLAWRDETYDLRRLERVWLVLVPFAGQWRGAAHLFVSFGFADGRHLAVSVEARRTRGQEYGVFAGMLRNYELVYVIGTEGDLIGRRAMVDGDPIYLYPVQTTPAKARELLTAMVARATALRAAPEFYHTAASNCTSNLVAHVNEVAPGRIPGGLKTALPGYADEVALALGLVHGTDVASLRARYRIDAVAREANGAPDYSARLRAALPR